MNNEELKKFVVQWNNRFPIDRWWRNKHKVAFLSEEHRKCSFFNQLMEFEEDKIFFELQKKKEEEKKKKTTEYIPNIGSWLNVDREVSADDVISKEDQEIFLDEVNRLLELEKTQDG